MYITQQYRSGDTVTQNNADTEARDEEDQKILHTVVYFNNLDVAKLLIEWSAKIETRDEDEKRFLTLLPAMVAQG